MNIKTQNRVVAALAIALEEINHPGNARKNKLDIDAMIRAILKEAAPGADLATWVKESLEELRVS